MAHAPSNAPALMPPAGFQRTAPAKAQFIYLGGNSQHWLNTFIEAHSLIIFTGRPWRGNAPDSTLNRLVLNAAPRRRPDVGRTGAKRSVRRLGRGKAWGN